MNIQRIRKFLIWFTLITLGLFALVALSLPTAARYSFNHWFKTQGIDAQITDAKINWTDGQILLSDIHGTKDTQEVLALNQVLIEWQWGGLFNHQIYVTTINLDGLHFNIEKKLDGNLIISGLDIAALTEAPAEKETQPEPEQKESTPLNWVARLGALNLTNFNVCYKDNNEDNLDYCARFSEMKWDGEIRYDLAQLTDTTIPLFTTGDYKLIDFKLHNNALEHDLLKAKEFFLTKVNIETLDAISIEGIRFTDLDVAQQIPAIESTQSMHFDSFLINKLSLSNILAMSNDGILKLGRVHLSNFNACHSDHIDTSIDYCSNFESMEWLGNIQYNLTTTSDQDIPLQVSGSYNLKQLSIKNNPLQRNLLSLNSLTIGDIKTKTLSAININNFTLSKLNLLQRKNDKKAAHITSIEAINIDEISLSDLMRLHINTAKIINHEVLILVNANNAMEIDEWLPKKSDVQSDTGESSTAIDETVTQGTEENKPFVFAIDSIKYETDKSTRFIDNSISPPLDIGLDDIKLYVTNIDNSKPNQVSKLDYAAVGNNFGTVRLDGDMTLFAEKISFDIDGKIAGIDLRVTSSAAEKAIGRSITSGQLDVDMKLLAKEDILDSNFDITLHHFELETTDKENSASIDANLGFPLNTSLLLLKDKDNSINLSIPITGDINDPNIKSKGAITSAVTKAITTAVLNFYTPYGIADSLISLATALEFEPLPFTPGTAEISTAAKDNITKISQLMAERPGIHLTMCGINNASDRIALYPDTETEKGDKEFKLKEEHKAGLEKLTAQRYSIIKQTFVDLNIEASRLVPCDYKYDATNELSGIEISI